VSDAATAQVVGDPPVAYRRILLKLYGEAHHGDRQ
jgi:hypothetical protein